MSMLEELLGDPDLWKGSAVYELATWKTVELKRCPQCGALTANPHTHKDWHLQNRM